MHTRFQQPLAAAEIASHLTLQPGGAREASGDSTRDERGVELIWGLKIPVRDGVQLNGTVYKPQGLKKALPVIFTLTPYIADSYHARGLYFAHHGYVFVCVDARGRGNRSEEHT